MWGLGFGPEPPEQGEQTPYRRYDEARPIDLSCTHQVIHKENVGGQNKEVAENEQDGAEFCFHAKKVRLKWRATKKPARKQALGGADGTRTRDPRRDRPIF